MAVVSRYVPVDLSGSRAVVAGASIAGLASALTLGERGAEVVVVEADGDPEAETAEEAFSVWRRPTVPQFRHSHAFLARLRNVLLGAYPEIYRALLDHGAAELRLLDFPPPALRPLTPEAGDERLAAIGCRRTTFEWVLRRHVQAMPWARFQAGRRLVALLAPRGTRVGGVRTEDERGRRADVEADLVIDATGRNSQAPQWLRGIGAAAPYEERSSSAILYYTRFYRLRAGVEFPRPGDEATMADFGWIKFAIFPADSRTFSITFAIPLALPRLKVLSRPPAFDRMVESLPGLARFVRHEVSEALPAAGRDILAMGGLENCLRRFVDPEGRPLAAGFFSIGDSAYHTNPLYGRGATQAFLHAGLLGEALDAAAGDVERAASFLDAAARAEIEPFYRASVAADGAAARKAERYREAARATKNGRATFFDWLADSFFDDGVIPATRVDPVVFRAFVRMFNMVETPERAFYRPEVLGRIVSVWARGRRFRDRHMPRPPDREATIAAAERSAGKGDESRRFAGRLASRTGV